MKGTIQKRKRPATERSRRSRSAPQEKAVPIAPDQEDEAKIETTLALEGRYSHCPESEVRGALATIKSTHDPYAALSLIEYFYISIHLGRALNYKFLFDYLDFVLGNLVVERQPIGHAFGLTLARGKYPREATTERDVEAAAYITLAMRHGKKYFEVVGDAVNALFGDGERGDRAVQDAYKEFGETFQFFPDYTLRALLNTELAAKIGEV